MTLTKSSVCKFGEKAKDFKSTLHVQYKNLSLNDVKGKNGTLSNVYLQSLPLC